MKSVKITIAVTPQVAAALDHLHSTGLFGFSRADAARRLVDEGVRRSVDFLPRRGKR